jgi:hypothetical protein
MSNPQIQNTATACWLLIIGQPGENMPCHYLLALDKLNGTLANFLLKYEGCSWTNDLPLWESLGLTLDEFEDDCYGIYDKLFEEQLNAANLLKGRHNSDGFPVGTQVMRVLTFLP